jgi:hypothetical protein
MKPRNIEFDIEEGIRLHADSFRGSVAILSVSDTADDQIETRVTFYASERDVPRLMAACDAFNLVMQAE